MGWEVSTPRKRCACRSDQGSGAVENDQKALKKRRKKRHATADGKTKGLGAILDSFWEPLGPILAPKGRSKNEGICGCFFGRLQGLLLGLLGGNGAAQAARGRPQNVVSAGRARHVGLGNLAKTEPGASNHLVFFG